MGLLGWSLVAMVEKIAVVEREVKKLTKEH
jgi:hypothetical protein